MKRISLFIIAAFALSIIAPDAEAQRFRRRGRGGSGLAAAAAIGAIGALALSSRNRGYYGGGYGGYGGYNRGYYGNGYGYSQPYGYRSSYIAPSAYGAMPFGAASFIDQGRYRNYYDAYGRYLGRERIF